MSIEMINPVFLRTFVRLCERRSFTRAAQDLHMTQPGVSQHLRWLEEHFGKVLIARDGRQFEMTEAGDRVLQYAHELFRSHDQLLQDVGRDDPHRGTIRLGSPGSFGTKMFRFLLELRADYPELVINYELAPNSSVLASLLAGELDVGFVNRKPSPDPRLEAWAVDQERLCLVVPKGFRGRSFTAYEELGLVDHPDGAYYLDQIMPHVFPKKYNGAATFPLAVRVNSLAMICEPVAAGFGFTALPEFACQAYPHQTEIRYFSPPEVPLDTIYAIARKNRPRPQRVDFILEQFARKK